LIKIDDRVTKGDKAMKINRADKHRAKRLKPAKKVRKSKLLSKRTIIETV